MNFNKSQNIYFPKLKDKCVYDFIHLFVFWLYLLIKNMVKY